MSVYLLVPTASNPATNTSSGTPELANASAPSNNHVVKAKLGTTVNVSANSLKSASLSYSPALDLSGTLSTANALNLAKRYSSATPSASLMSRVALVSANK